MLKLKRFLAQAASFTALTIVLSNAAHAQTLSTIAGSNTGLGFAGDGGQAVGASPPALLSSPFDVLARADGSVLIADFDNSRVRRVGTNGVITTVAGGGAAAYTSGALATSVSITKPRGLAEDAAGNFYIAAAGSIRKVTPVGVIVDFAGSSTASTPGADGSDATSARIQQVNAMAVDNLGNLFFTDAFDGKVRKVDAAGKIFTIASGLFFPLGIAVAPDGSLIVGERFANQVLKIVPGGAPPTVLASVTEPWGIALDGAGGFFVATSSDNRVFNVSASRVVTTLLGDGNYANTGDGGLASATVSIRTPFGLSRDRAGNLFIASSGGHVIRKITFPPPPPGPSIFTAAVNPASATLGTITPAGEQTVPFGGVINLTVTANPRHVLRVASSCDYVQTSRSIAFVPIGTGTSTYNVTVNGPCQMEANFTPLIPKVNVNSEMAANALFIATERAFNYIRPTTIAQTSSTVGQAVKFKAWVTDIAGVPYPSATNVITFKNNGAVITGCSNVPLTLRNSDVIHIREATCTTTFTATGNSVITAEFAGDTYNFPAASSGLNHSVSAAP